MARVSEMKHDLLLGFSGLLSCVPAAMGCSTYRQDEDEGEGSLSETRDLE